MQHFSTVWMTTSMRGTQVFWQQFSGHLNLRGPASHLAPGLLYVLHRPASGFQLVQLKGISGREEIHFLFVDHLGAIVFFDSKLHLSPSCPLYKSLSSFKDRNGTAPLFCYSRILTC